MIGSAVIPTMIANAFFVPSHLLKDADRLVEAVEAVGGSSSTDEGGRGTIDATNRLEAWVLFFAAQDCRDGE